LTVCLQGGCRTEQPWPLWESYTRNAIDPQGRVVDHSAGDRTTSEGQAYAMFFALIDGDRSRFDKLFQWTQDNLAGGDLSLHLAAWSWGKAPDGSWRILDQNPASDADLWMAYTLMEAGRLWHDPRYQKIGVAMAGHIAQQEVVMIPGLGTTLLSGPQGFHPEPNTWILNPSYMPLPVLSYFATTQPQGPWQEVLATVPMILSQASPGGFAMDWVAAGSELRPSPAPFERAAGNLAAPALGSYDAIRVYLWLGIADPETPGVEESLGALNGMATYLKHHPAPPERVSAAALVIDPNPPPGFSAAVVPYLQTIGMQGEAKAQLDRIAAMKDAATGLYGKSAAYYDQNLALFATGWTERRYRFDRDGRLTLKWK
jgi:endoglucanase